MSTPQAAREMVFCHQCENEWYRDEHGLTCPDCHSEFTEIIEPDHDPRDTHLHDDFDEEPHPFLTHNPWTVPDPEESTPEPNPFGNGLRVQRNGPNSFSITGTWATNFGNPRGREDHPADPNVFANPIFRNFATMMQGIAGGTGRAPQGDQQGQGQPGSPGAEESRTGGPQRFTYSTRLYPRDANNPGPHVEPTDSLHEVIAGILGGGAFGPPPHARDPDRGPGSPGGGGVPANPLAALFASLLNPQLAAHGDAVYSQEALDRVISQLMEQNATGNAPGPASAEAIAALPKKKVTRQMVGAGDSPPDFPEDQLHGECSICMDEVPIGEVVTELPCGHWFHGACIEAWLGEHDTCPHCRQGIERKEDKQGEQGGAGPGGGAAGSSASGSGSGSGSSTSNTPGNNNDGGNSSSNQHDDSFYPNMPGGLYTTSYRVVTPRSLLRPRNSAPPPLFPILPFHQTASFPPQNHSPRSPHHHDQHVYGLFPLDELMSPQNSRGGHHTHTQVTVVRQRRRSSLSRWASNVSHGVSVAVGGGGSTATHAGGDRPGIGERLRSLFRS